MSSDFWFVDRSRQRRGPVAEDEIRRLIAAGTIGRETLVWTSGMADWRPAGEIESFASLFGPPAPVPASAPVPAPALPGGPAAGASSVTALRPSLPVWGLLGHCLLVEIGMLLVIPAPWTTTLFYGWLSEHIALPDGRSLRFAGKPGDIWYVLVALAAVVWGGQLFDYGSLVYGSLVVLLLSWILTVLVIRWFVANLETQDGPLNLSFEGGILPYVGWNLLLIVSFVTIIGWAWAASYMMQWLCRNVRGAIGFEFTGTGLEILWRSLVFTLLCVFVIPIPWMLRWYVSWLISQVSVVEGGARP